MDILKNLALFSLISAFSLPVSTGGLPSFTIWNVGQGQWLTYSSPRLCTHFDAGGERLPSRTALLELCQAKRNFLFLSHWDLDHLGFVSELGRILTIHCADLPSEPTKPLSGFKQRIRKKLAVCRRGEISSTLVRRIFSGISNSVEPNDVSRVVEIGGVLIPGDASSKTEKLWAHQAAGARVLILGHHGSRSATSEFLIGRATGLRLAIASARQKKYGHPHREVIKRLRLRGVPVLRTEDWGNIVLQFRK